jgi:thiaminase/transcriptional activator TenA
LRDAAGGLHGILEMEIGHHTEYCATWGLTPEDLEAAAPDHATLAYTRYVLERGMAGDLLDLKTALAPCIIGYGEIGRRLAADSATRRDGNPYTSWIDIYSGEQYQGFVAAEIASLDRLSATRGGEARFADLTETFRTATALEADFWQMGLDAAA